MPPKKVQEPKHVKSKKELEVIDAQVIEVPVEQSSMTIMQVKDMVDQVQGLLQTVMKQGTHYGTVPGTKGKSLWKAGADKICLAFRLRPEFTENVQYLDNGHMDASYHCRLLHIPSGKIVSEGVGSASTLETKHRYRYEEVLTNIVPPKEYYKGRDPDKLLAVLKQKKIEVPPNCELVTMQNKTDGKVYIGFKIKGENPNPGDLYNTVRKMGKKRAFVDAAITAVAASDMFTQDLEDI
jgi:hypothetical protein